MDALRTEVEKSIFTEEEIAGSERVQIWLINSSNSTNTTKAYIRGLRKFCNFIKESPDQIISKWRQARHSKGNTHAEMNKVQDYYEDKLRLFKSDLERQGLSGSTISCYVNTTKSFFKAFALPFTNISTKSKPKYIDARLTRENLQKIIHHSKSRDKAFFLFMRDSGLRPETICLLDLKDLGKVFDTEYGKVQVVNVTERKGSKTEWDRKTFITFETIDALKDYLEIRKRGTEYIKPENVTEDSPIFVIISNAPKRADVGCFCSQFKRIVKRLGLHKRKTKGGRVERLREYAIRDYFITVANHSGASRNTIGYFTGHKRMLGIEYHYYNPTEEELLEQYLKIMPHLLTDIHEREINGLAKELEKAKEQIEYMQSDEYTLKRMKQLMPKLMEYEEVPKEKKVVKIEKAKTDQIVKLLEEGYKVTVENKGYVIMTK